MASHFHAGIVLASFALATAAGCLRTDVKQCADGQLCPADQECAPLGGCATPDQLQACDGIDDNLPCSVGDDNGLCFGGVCSYGASNCGNGIREGAEACDDENHQSGDGCSPDCRSDETCGNLVVDEFIGEECEVNFEPADCVELGSDYGRYGCSSNCRLAASECGLFGFVPSFTQYTGDFGAMWGFSDGQLIATTPVASFHFDGLEWTSKLIPIDAQVVWGASPDDVYAAAVNGQRAHYDGEEWTLHTSGLIFDIWGTPDGQVYGGSGGGLYRIEGTELVLEKDGVYIVRGWAAAPDSMYFIGPGGELYYYDGDSVATLDMGVLVGGDFSGASAKDVHGTSAFNVFVATTVGVIHFDGVDWSVVPNSDDTRSIVALGQGLAVGSFLEAVGFLSDTGVASFPFPGGAPGRLFTTDGETLFAASGEIIFRHTGAQWLAPPNVTGLTHVASDGSAGFVAVGSAGTSGQTAAIRSDGGGGWQGACAPTSYCANGGPVVAGWVDAIAFVGVREDGAATHYAGSTLSQENVVSTPLRDVAGPVITNLFAVGDGGVVQRRVGVDAWFEIESPTVADLNAAAFDGLALIAVGDGGTVLSCDSVAATLLDLGLSADLTSVWSDGNQTSFIGDADGALWKLTDGVAALEQVFDSAIVDVAGSSDSDLFVATADGGLFHWNGAAKSAVRFPVPAAITSMAATGSHLAVIADGRVWVLVRSHPW